MTRLSNTIEALKKHWLRPERAVHRGEPIPFLLACNFSTEGASATMLEQLPFKVPEDALEFWQESQSATLFKDQEYGQWGIQMLTPAEALAETRKRIASRPGDYLHTDLVLGRFFGDSDLLVVLCDPGQDDFGSIMIASPIDPRKDWPIVAKSLAEFLARLLEAQGDKYWEVHQGKIV